MKELLSSKLVIVEFFVILLILLINQIGLNVSQDFLINFTFILLLISLFIIRRGTFRQMHLAFILLILSAIGDTFGYYQFVYITSGLVLCLLALGIINMLLFKDENKKT